VPPWAPGRRRFSMRVLGVTLVACVALGLSAWTEDKKPASNAEKIVGTWEGLTGASRGSLVEFTKEGKVKVTVEGEGRPRTMEGTYKVEKDTLTVALEEGGQTVTIKSLTETKLVLQNKGGDTAEFKRKK